MLARDPNRAPRRLFGAGALCILSLAACSGSSASSTSSLPPPSLSIANLLPAGGPQWTPGSTECLARGQDPDGTVVVVLKIDTDEKIPNWTLAPPYGCGVTPQCGFVVVTATALDSTGSPIGTPTVRVPAVATTIAVPLGRLARQTGSDRFRIVVALWDGTNLKPFTSGDTAMTVQTDVELCTPRIDGGADAAPSAEGDGGRDASASLDGGAEASSNAESGIHSATDGGHDATAG